MTATSPSARRASRISTAGAGSSANGGALAMSAVLIALCLVGALAAVERQEL